MGGRHFISVVIPAYQAEATIAGCLEAVISQKDFKEFEVIVVDDHSPDRTAEIAQGFPVRLVRLEENQGAGAARNRGAEKAEGDVLLFVDADVYLEPGSLATAARVFQGNPDVAAAVGTYTGFPATDDAVSVYHNFFTYYHHELSPDWIGWFWGAIGAVRKDVFNRAGGFSELYRGAAAEDMELGYKMSQAGYKIAYRRDLRGTHARRFTLWDMLFNDYRKAVLGVKLYLTRKERGIHAHGFSNPRNGISLVIMYPLLFSLLAYLFTGMAGSILIISLAIFAGVNYPFYRFIHEKRSGNYVFHAALLHLLSFTAIAAGVVMGLAGLALGRPLESDSPWL
jgi:glycosyltransferase involved in cell wall biosynthesis